jgi:hypothetical protein
MNVTFNIPLRNLEGKDIRQESAMAALTMLAPVVTQARGADSHGMPVLVAAAYLPQRTQSDAAQKAREMAGTLAWMLKVSHVYAVVHGTQEALVRAEHDTCDGFEPLLRSHFLTLGAPA